MKFNTIEALKARRTHYSLKKSSPLTKEEIIRLVKEAVLHTPSAFNSQSARVVVLFEENHETLWKITEDTLKKIVPEDHFASTEAKMKMFSNAFGTILFFEDEMVIKGLQENFALYKDNFPIWSNQSAGMLNLSVWTALSENGLGASLQHYNPLIDEEVKKRFNLPSSWKLIAQMPFGEPNDEPGEKEYQNIDERVKVF